MSNWDKSASFLPAPSWSFREAHPWERCPPPPATSCPSSGSSSPPSPSSSTSSRPSFRRRERRRHRERRRRTARGGRSLNSGPVPPKDVRPRPVRPRLRADLRRELFYFRNIMQSLRRHDIQSNNTESPSIFKPPSLLPCFLASVLHFSFMERKQL